MRAMSRPDIQVYVAGPDVFASHWDTFRQEITQYAVERGITPIFPKSQPDDGPADIYRCNTRLIRQADAVIANLQCFRGSEPDSGTVFEVGFAIALGRPVWGFNAAGLYHEKVAEHYGLSPDRAFPITCKAGYAVESFSQDLNLMLAIPVRLRATWQEALDDINWAESFQDAKPNSQEYPGRKNPR
jgi:nucleoside 2-deoxyribosyltransferase